jgi:hypothetical protein
MHRQILCRLASGVVQNTRIGAARRKWPIQLFPRDPALRCFEGRVGHNDGSLVGILRRQPIFVSQAYLDSIRATHHTSVCAEVDVVFILPLFK